MTRHQERHYDLPLTSEGTLEIDLRQGATLRLVGSDRESFEAIFRGGEGTSPAQELEVEATDLGVSVRLPMAARATAAGGLTVEVHCPRRLQAKIRSSGGHFSAEGLEGRLEGSLSAGNIRLFHFSGTVDFKTGAGDVELEGCSLSGRIETQTGGIRVEAGKSPTAAPGDLSLHSGVGDILVAGTGQGLKLDTACGNIRVTGVPGPLRAATGQGNVVVEKIGGPSGVSSARGRAEVGGVDPTQESLSLEVASVNGSIDVSLPVDLDMKLDVRLEKTRGRWLWPKLRSDFNLPKAQDPTPGAPNTDGNERRSTKAVFGKGEHRIDLRAVDGDVRVRRSK
jgi:DUF4097 and DUF4098 domain-containing protein YvlB